MFSLLHQYLVNNSSVVLPGIGTLQFVNISALPLADGNIMPPKREIKLSNIDVNETSPQLLVYLSKQLDITETQIQTLFQHFLQTIKTTLAEQKAIQWENVGEFRNDDTGKISFFQTPTLDGYYQPIEAKRINHRNASDKYDVLVGDNETNNVAIQDEWNASANKKSHWWWIWAIIIAVIALVVIAIKYAG